jgi:cytochrome P450
VDDSQQPPRACIANELVSAEAHADEARIDAAFRHLRAKAPIYWAEPDDYRPFWALSRHGHIMEVSRKNDIFINSRRLNLLTRGQEHAVKSAGGKLGRMYRTIAHMDNPDHRAYRRVTSDWFMGSGIKAREKGITAIATEFVDRMQDAGAHKLDFAKEIASLYTLRVIMSIIGVPAEDQPFMLKVTQEFFGSDDPDLRREGGEPGTHFGVLREILDYFTQLAEDRRKNPCDDLASVIANARIDDQPMGDLETASYFAVLATAGHDTTAAMTAGGLLALIQHPQQWQDIRANPTLMRGAVEEMLRWVTPVKHFLRTCTTDYRLDDITIRAGDGVALFYFSANRDEAVFAEPYEFDIRRSPNKHLAFGFGGHMCLGLMLARLELSIFFHELIRRCVSVAVDGPIHRVKANFVGGFKSLPMRCTFA